jgi:hypothetical protein
MKKNIIFSILFLGGILLAAQGALAQASNKDKRQLHINATGEVSDDQGNKLGYISKEEIVYNNEGEKLGFFENGKVFDADGKPLGKAKKNGTYHNNKGKNIVIVKGDGDICEILDPQGHKMGTVHKNYKLHACATHCFFLEKEMNKGENK